MILTDQESLPFLTQESEEVDPTSEETKETVRLLLQEVHQIGIGLAAPQIGRRESIVVMQLDQVNSTDSSTMTVCINPVVIFDPSGGFVYSVEGCLSVPDRYFAVRRYKKVILSYLDTNGDHHSRNLEDFPAVVAQHEVDHLLGILICEVGKLLKSPDEIPNQDII